MIVCVISISRASREKIRCVRFYIARPLPFHCPSYSLFPAVIVLLCRDEGVEQCEPLETGKNLLYFDITMQHENSMDMPMGRCV